MWQNGEKLKSLKYVLQAMSLKCHYSIITEDFRFYSAFVLQKAETAAKSSSVAAPPADKKARMEKPSDNFSLEAEVPSIASKVFSHWSILT